MSSLTGSKQHNLGSNSPGNVRVVARIRGLTNKEQIAASPGLNPWISVCKPGGDASENVTLSFGDQSTSQREASQVHYCYEPEEDNSMIFEREIKHLIPAVFEGHSTSVVAYGAIGSGKTYTIQGSDDNPGLAILAMDEIISEAERLGRSVSMSFYEVHQEQAFDLINTKRPVISILRDGQGRIQLKGLSRAPIKSISEFCKIYRPRKPIQKNRSELPRRSHKGLIIYVTMPNDDSKTSPRGKMNFLDFAGYEDPRRKSSDGNKVMEINKRNKSLNALQKVILALNANERHVPFRESIVTRMLQDSLGCANKVTIVACLNPTFCQDSISMASLASRTFEVISRCYVASTKSVKTSNKVLGLSSSKIGIPKSTSASVKKPTASHTHFLKKKAGDETPSIKGKKLFVEVSQSKTPVQTTSVSSIALTVESSMLEESCSSTTKGTSLQAEKSCADTPKTSLEGETTSPMTVVFEMEAATLNEKSCVDTPTKKTSLEGETTSPMTIVFEMEDATLNDASQVRDDKIHFVHNPVYNHCELVPNNSAKASSLAKEGDIMDKENNSLSVNRLNTDASPPLSTRLQELSNSLKFLCSTPIPIDLPQESNLLSGGVVGGVNTDIEPKTPSFAPRTKVHEAYEITPREVSRTCFPATKVSLVQEYLRFINSASKEELKGLKGIGEKRASYILELREESPEAFKSLDDLKDIGLSAKQIKKMLSIK